MANCLRRRWRAHVSRSKTSHGRIRVTSVYTIPAEQWTGDEIVEPREDDEFCLNALKGKGKGFKGQCFSLCAFGHRVADCRRKAINVRKGRRSTRGLSQQIIRHRNKCRTEKVKGRCGNSWTWSDPWSASWNVPAVQMAHPQDYISNPAVSRVRLRVTHAILQHFSRKPLSSKMISAVVNNVRRIDGGLSDERSPAEDDGDLQFM